MTLDKEVHEFLLKHLQMIMENNIEGYHQTTSDDLSLYEWWITPHRIDGLPFHDFMMTENAQRGEVFGSESEAGSQHEEKVTRFDLANLRIQRYGDTAIASYTLLISTGMADRINVATHNESRVMINFEGQWKVVHVHKSPDWLAPHIKPEINL